MFGIKELCTLTVERGDLNTSGTPIFYFDIWFSDDIKTAWVDLGNNLKINNDKISFYLNDCGYYAGRMYVKFKNNKSIKFQIEFTPSETADQVFLKVTNLSKEK